MRVCVVWPLVDGRNIFCGSDCGGDSDDGGVVSLCSRAQVNSKQVDIEHRTAACGQVDDGVVRGHAVVRVNTHVHIHRVRSFRPDYYNKSVYCVCERVVFGLMRLFALVMGIREKQGHIIYRYVCVCVCMHGIMWKRFADVPITKSIILV